MADRRLAVEAQTVKLLVERFVDVGLDARIQGRGPLGDALHEPVRHPLRSRRAEPQVDARVAGVGGMQIVHDREIGVLADVAGGGHQRLGVAAGLGR